MLHSDRFGLAYDTSPFCPVFHYLLPVGHPYPTLHTQHTHKAHTQGDREMDITHVKTCVLSLIPPSLLPPCTQVEVDKLVSTHMRKEERGSWGTWFRWGRRSSSIPAKINEVSHSTHMMSYYCHVMVLWLSHDSCVSITWLL